VLELKIRATSHGYVEAYRDLTITYTVSEDAVVPDFVIVIPETTTGGNDTQEIKDTLANETATTNGT